MKRTPLPRKRAGKKRRTLSPRCMVRGCKNIARIQTWCRKHAIAECDRRARAVARAEVRFCTRCGSPGPGLQWSHHISRARLRVRWHPLNATMHCAPCHTLFTNHSALHVEWIRDHIGPDAYDLLLDIAYGPRSADGVRRSPGPVHDYEIEVWLSSLPPIEEAA